MKEYIKPDFEIVLLASEMIATSLSGGVDNPYEEEED